MALSAARPACAALCGCMAWLSTWRAAACRDEIASCSEQAYTHLSLADAQKLMMLGSQKDVLAFAEKVGLRHGQPVLHHEHCCTRPHVLSVPCFLPCTVHPPAATLPSMICLAACTALRSTALLCSTHGSSSRSRLHHHKLAPHHHCSSTGARLSLPPAPCPLQHGWTVQGSNIMFQPQAEAGATKELPSIELINNALVYAKELERIV